jgi:hypothetical protein
VHLCRWYTNYESAIDKGVLVAEVLASVSADGHLSNTKGKILNFEISLVGKKKFYKVGRTLEII